LRKQILITTILFFLFINSVSAIITHCGDVSINQSYFDNSTTVSYNVSGWTNVTGSNYLQNQSSDGLLLGVLDINETPLNATIDARMNYTNASPISLTVARIFSLSLCAASQIYKMDAGGTFWECAVDQAGGGSGGFTGVDDLYINNVSGVITFNQTVNNGTINSIVQTYNSSWNYTVDTDTHNTSVEMRNAINTTQTYQISVLWANILNRFITSVQAPWLYMVGTTATFNESELYVHVYNKTEVNALNSSWNYTVDTDTNASTACTGGNVLNGDGNCVANYNTTLEMINAVNNTALNASQFTDLPLDTRYVLTTGDDMTGDLNMTGNANHGGYGGCIWQNSTGSWLIETICTQ